MIDTQFLVPAENHAPMGVDHAAWMDLERRLAGEFGGFTKHVVYGEWVEPNSITVVKDTLVSYEVALKSWNQLPAWLELVVRTRRKFQQQALFIKVAGVPEII